VDDEHFNLGRRDNDVTRRLAKRKNSQRQRRAKRGHLLLTSRGRGRTKPGRITAEEDTGSTGDKKGQTSKRKLQAVVVRRTGGDKKNAILSYSTWGGKRDKPVPTKKANLEKGKPEATNSTKSKQRKKGTESDSSCQKRGPQGGGGVN